MKTVKVKVTYTVDLEMPYIDAKHPATTANFMMIESKILDLFDDELELLVDVNTEIQLEKGVGE